jgi:DNA-binding CsgD family transcriptional regulator
MSPYEHALHAVGRGPDHLGDRAEVDHPYGLTSEERGVVELLCMGLSNQAICAATSIKPRTVEWRLTAAMKKMGAGSRLQVALRWVREQEEQRAERLMAHIHRSQHKGMPREGCPLCETFNEEEIA